MVGKTVRIQCQARITSNCVGLLRSIADPSKYSNSAKRLAAAEFVSNVCRLIFNHEILREVSDREPAIRLVVDRHTLNEPTAKLCCGEELPFRDSKVIWKIRPTRCRPPVSILIEACVFCMNALPVFSPPDATS